MTAVAGAAPTANAIPAASAAADIVFMICFIAVIPQTPPALLLAPRAIPPP